MVARVGPRGIHGDELARAHRHPTARRHAHPGWTVRHGWRFRRHRVVELPVVEHLRPDAAVDDAPDVFQELAVDVLGDRRTGLRRVDGCLDGLSLSKRERWEEEGRQQQTPALRSWIIHGGTQSMMPPDVALVTARGSA